MNNSLIAQRQQLMTSLRQTGIRDPAVLRALASIPREQFIPEELQGMAYANRALPLSLGQTISQPLMVAAMTQALQLSGQECVLEIGTGSGYHTAILSLLAGSVYTIERHAELTGAVSRRLTALRISNVTLLVGDGTLGWPEAAPYDRILVTAAAPAIPAPLIDQLVVGGIMVLPVGKANVQDLLVVQKGVDDVHIHSLGPCVFVPLVGQEGWRVDPHDPQVQI